MSWRERVIHWQLSGDPFRPWQALVDGQEWFVRINEFPSEPHVYTLIIGDRSVGEFDEWPPAWTHPPLDCAPATPDRAAPPPGANDERCVLPERSPAHQRLAEALIENLEHNQARAREVASENFERVKNIVPSKLVEKLSPADVRPFEFRGRVFPDDTDWLSYLRDVLANPHSHTYFERGSSLRENLKLLAECARGTHHAPRIADAALHLIEARGPTAIRNLDGCNYASAPRAHARILTLLRSWRGALTRDPNVVALVTAFFEQWPGDPDALRLQSEASIVADDAARRPRAPPRRVVGHKAVSVPPELLRPIRWTQTGDPLQPYHAEVDSERWQVYLMQPRSVFDPRFALIIVRKIGDYFEHTIIDWPEVACRFREWPAAWTRADAPEDPTQDPLLFPDNRAR